MSARVPDFGAERAEALVDRIEPRRRSKRHRIPQRAEDPCAARAAAGRPLSMSEMRVLSASTSSTRSAGCWLCSCIAAVKRAISLVSRSSRSAGARTLLPLERIDAVIDVAHAVFDRAHAVLEGIDLDRVLHLLGEMHLEVGELADRRGDIVEAPRQRPTCPSRGPAT